MSTMTYGDISPRTAAFVVRDLLKRGMPWLIFEKFGQSKPLPSNSTKSLQFRRYYLDSTFTTGAAATGRPYSETPGPVWWLPVRSGRSGAACALPPPWHSSPQSLPDHRLFHYPRRYAFCKSPCGPLSIHPRYP